MTAALVPDDGARILMLKAARTFHLERLAKEQEAAAAELEELLGFQEAGLAIVGARIIGRGDTASADLYLKDPAGHGVEITFKTLRDVARPSSLSLALVAYTGVVATFKARDALKALSLLREIAEHQETFTEDHVAFDWGCDYLQAAPVIDVDMTDQGERWGAFVRLRGISPLADARFEGRPLASTNAVLRHHDGTRYVRAGWFKDAIRGRDPGISATELAGRMQRVGWKRPGGEGLVKATQPGGKGQLSWSFYLVDDAPPAR